MRKIKTKQTISVIDGNSLIGKLVDEKDSYIDHCLNTINDLPDSHDISRVMKIKEKVSNGSYNFDEKISGVVDAIIKESTDKNPISLTPFES